MKKIFLLFSVFVASFVFGNTKVDFSVANVQSVYDTMYMPNSGVYQKDGIVFVNIKLDVKDQKRSMLRATALLRTSAYIKQEFGISTPYKLKSKVLKNRFNYDEGILEYITAFSLTDIKQLQEQLKKEIEEAKAEKEAQERRLAEQKRIEAEKEKARIEAEKRRLAEEEKSRKDAELNKQQEALKDACVSLKKALDKMQESSPDVSKKEVDVIQPQKTLEQKSTEQSQSASISDRTITEPKSQIETPTQVVEKVPVKEESRVKEALIKEKPHVKKEVVVEKENKKVENSAKKQIINLKTDYDPVSDETSTKRKNPLLWSPNQ